MSYSLNSGTLSSRSLGGCLRYPASSSSCGGFYPGHAYNYPGGTVAFAPGVGTCQQGGPAYGCQESCWEPAGGPAPGYGRRPSSSLCRPPQGPCPGSSSGCSGSGSGSGFGPFGYGYGGSRAQSQGCGFGYCRPTYFSSRTYQGPSFQPACGSGGCYGQTYGQTY